MRFFTGRHERTIDEKNRIQLPSDLRSVIDPERDGPGLYVTLGEDCGTLSIFTERGFEELGSRIETEFISGEASRQFERQFYGLSSRVDIDKQGRFVLPEHLVKKARLGSEVLLLGQKYRIDIWRRTVLDSSMGIVEAVWDGEKWPDWQGFLRMRPGTPPKPQV